MTTKGGYKTAPRDSLDRVLQARLPLPLARLYGRAVCAARLHDRHEAACHLFETTAKLAAAIEVARYQDSLDAHGSERDPAFDALLLKLALPNPGTWNAILRARAENGDDGSEHRGPASTLNKPMDDLPAMRAAVTLVSGGDVAPLQTVKPALLLDLLPAYRAHLTAGHPGNDTPSPWDVTAALVAAFTELTCQTPLLDQLVLRAVENVRVRPDDSGDGELEVFWLDLRGLQPRRLPPEKLPARDDLVSGSVCWLGHGGRCLSLHPLALLHGNGAFCRFYMLHGSARDGEVRYIDPVAGRACYPVRPEEEGSDLLFADLRCFLQRFTTVQVTESEYWRLRDATLDDPAAAAGTSTTLDATEAIGQVYGPYILWGELGRGAVSVTHLASQRALGNYVMLTVLPPALLLDPVATVSLRRELGAVARCDHPNVLRVLDTGEANGTAYYATELPVGCSLGTLGSMLVETGSVAEAIAAGTAFDRQPHEELERLPRPSEPRLPRALSEGSTSQPCYRALAFLFAGAARGLHHLHAQGVVHRRIAPGRLSVSAEDGRVIIPEPDLAPVLEPDDPIDEPADEQTWDDGMPSPHTSGFHSPRRHMAPEQLLLPSQEVDRRADIYGLGATLYEVVTGEALFVAAAGELMAQLILERPPRQPSAVRPGVPQELEAVILRCLAKNAEERYPTAAELAEALEQVAGGAVASSSTARLASLLPAGARMRVKALRRLVEKSALSVRIGLAALLVAVAVGAFGVCTATSERDLALDALARARSAGLVAAAQRAQSEDPVLAAFLARQAVQANPSVAAISRLYATLQNPLPVATVDAAVVAAEPLPEGRGLLLASETSVAKTDLHGNVLWQWQRPAPAAPGFPMTLLPGPGLLLTLHQKAPAALIDLDGKLVSRLHGQPLGQHGLFIAPDATVLALTGARASLWRLRRGHVAPGAALGDRVVAAAWAPDGLSLATATADGFLEVRANDGAMISRFPRGKEGGSVRVAMLGGGERILTYDADEGRWADVMKLWSLGGDVIERWTFPRARPRPVLWSDPSAQHFVLTWPGGAIDVYGSDGVQVCSIAGDDGPGWWSIDMASTGTHFVASGRGPPVLWSVQCDSLAQVGDVAHGFSRDGERLLAAAGKELRVWAAEGYLLGSLIHPAPVLGARFATAGQGRAIASWTASQVFAWDTSAGLTVALHHGQSVKRAFFAEGGRTVVTEHAGVTLWHLDDHSRPQSRHVLPETHFMPMLLPPGDRLVVRVAEQGPGKGATWSRVTNSKAEALADVSLSGEVEYRADGELFVGLVDRIVRDAVPDDPRPHAWLGVGIWHRNGKRRATLRARDDDITSAALLFDGEHVATGHLSGMVRIWSLNGTAQGSFTVGSAPVTRLVSSPTEDALFVLCGLHAALWRADGELLWRWPVDNVGNARFTPAGDRLVSEPFTTFTHETGFQGTSPEQWGPVRMWRTDGSEVKLDTQCPLHYVPPLGFPMRLSPDAERLVLWCGHRAEVLDLDGNRVVTVGAGAAVEQALWSPDGSVLVTQHADGALWVWHGKGEAWLRLPGHDAPVNSVSFSNNGKLLLTAADDRTARIWPLLSLQDLQNYASGRVPTELGRWVRQRYTELLEP